MTQDTQMQLTVVMPAYNASRYISTTIYAIVNQTFTDWKLIVINDSSTDNTQEIVEEWCRKDKRIQLVNNWENIKVARSMNKGIALVESPYFTRIDSDDVPLPTHFETLIGYLEAHPDISICGSQVITIDAQGAFRRKWNYETDSEWIKMSAIFACPFLQSSVIMKTEVINDIGGYKIDKELVEDYELWIRALQKYKAANISAYTIQYRIHASNMSESNKNRIMQMLEQLYQESESSYPIDRTHLSLHARMEFGDWSAMTFHKMKALHGWSERLIAINRSKQFYPQSQYKQVVKKYFTNTYLKIATQNSGKLKCLALLKAFMFSPRYFMEIWKRRKENLVPPVNL